MKRKLLIVLLSTILCTSCDYEPLFFKTNKKAIPEEINSFINNIHEYNTLIPDGWYEFKKVVSLNGRENITELKFYLKNVLYSKEYPFHFEFPFLIGTSNNGKYRYFCNKNVLIFEYTTDNGEIKRYGSTTAKYHLEGPVSLRKYENIEHYSDEIEFYINNNFLSIYFLRHLESFETYLFNYSVGIEYDEQFDKIVRIRESWDHCSFLNNVDGKNEYSYGTCNYYISSCDPFDINFDQNYVEEVPYNMQYIGVDPLIF